MKRRPKAVCFYCDARTVPIYPEVTKSECTSCGSVVYLDRSGDEVITTDDPTRAGFEETPEWES